MINNEEIGNLLKEVRKSMIKKPTKLLDDSQRNSIVGNILNDFSPSKKKGKNQMLEQVCVKDLIKKSPNLPFGC